MTDIPQVDDQFVEDVPALRQTLTDRFPLLCSGDISVEELRRALGSLGFALTAHPEGWCLDKVHAMALVLADCANEDTTLNDAPYIRDDGFRYDAEGRN